MYSLESIASWCYKAIEAIGISIITITALSIIFIAIYHLYKKRKFQAVYEESRKFLGRGILLGLEFLVAADIIRTVAVELTFESIGTLAIVVLIRTFLSYSLEVEISGNWPWQNSGE